jgi:hypothetical protein
MPVSALMASADGLPGELLRLISRHRAEPEDAAGAFGWLRRLCRVATRDLAASAAGVTLVSAEGEMVTVATSGVRAARLEGLQLELGEGPCVDAFASRRPVLVATLDAQSVGTWPGFGPAAHEEGVRAVFALPLQIGAARLGALDIYRDEASSLSRVELARALTYAELAVGALLEAQDSDPTAMLTIDDPQVGFIVYQAQGMVMIQLDAPPTVALARLRAHAFADGRSLGDVAADVVARRLTLERDDG